ncbi:MAG: SPOR domain-containing protein [Candidatus Accumulibacter sp.]|jgi:cell division protein FtsN|nr:SPOR domain-containing protein [Accumulibacter sp.]
MIRHSSSRKTSAGNTIIGLFIGLVVGMLVSAAVVWYLNKSPVPFAGTGRTLPRQENAQPPTPLALPGKPGDPIPEVSPDKPRFDFYRILPGNTDTLPAPTRPDATAPSASSPAPGASGAKPDPKDVPTDPLFLQTGSFQSAGDADGQKARLAMMGIEASIQQVMVQDKVWYRVRIGPFKKQDDLAAVRSGLARQGIQANTVK